MYEKKNICVVSMENNTGHMLYIASHANHVAYCRRNEYTYFEVNDFSRYPDRNYPHLYKFNVIDEAMQKYPDMDYYLWMDTDAFFTSMETRLESFIHDENAQMLMTRDHSAHWHGSMFDYGYCSGVVILKNTQDVRKFIKEETTELMYNLGTKMRQTGIIYYKDQDMFTFLAQIGGYRGILVDIPHEGFRSFRRPPKNGNVFTAWKKGDYILHLLGNKFARKQEILKEIGYDLSTGEVGING